MQIFFEKFGKLCIAFFNYFNLSGYLIFIWEIIGSSFFLLLIVSLLFAIKKMAYLSLVFLKEVKAKLKQWWKDINFLLYVRRAKPLYERNSPLLNKIASKSFIGKNIGA